MYDSYARKAYEYDDEKGYMKDPNIHMRKAGLKDTSLLYSLIHDSHHDVAESFGLTLENCPRHPSNCTREWIEKDLLRGVVYYIVQFDGCLGQFSRVRPKRSATS